MVAGSMKRNLSTHLFTGNDGLPSEIISHFTDASTGEHCLERAASEDWLISQPLEVGDVELTDVVKPEDEHGQSLKSHAPSEHG